MNFTRRLEIIFDSSVGSLLAFFLLLFLLLLTIYCILRWRQKTLDALAYCFVEHYERIAQVTASKLHFIGKHKAKFWGRQTVVRMNGESYLSLALAPDVFDHHAVKRFSQYLFAIEHRNIPLLTDYAWAYAQDGLCVVCEDHLLKNDGRFLASLKEYFLDYRLGYADAELLLLEIARSLASLHETKTQTGEALYYGILRPSSIFIDFDSRQRINKLFLAQHGFYFASDQKALSQRFERIACGEIIPTIDSQALKDCRDEMRFLAPEQKDPKCLDSITSKVDFYAFAVLASELLLGDTFSKESFNPQKLPSKWRGFIERCLSFDPKKRPHDFLELQDRLYDPDMALTHHEIDLDKDDECFDEDDDLNLQGLRDVLQELSASPKQESSQSIEHLKRIARQFLSNSKWGHAKKQLLKVHQQHPKDAETLAGLAIVFYEEGKFDKAEMYYEKAKVLDFRQAKRFREHIAFRV